MPELPDVEIIRRYFTATSLHQNIDHIQLGDDRSQRSWMVSMFSTWGWR